MTIHLRCPRCSKNWDHEEFPAQSCFGCNYPGTQIRETEQDAMEQIEGYAWWPRVDVNRYLDKTDKRAA